jgi:hypothetical protein
MKNVGRGVIVVVNIVVIYIAQVHHPTNEFSLEITYLMVNGNVPIVALSMNMSKGLIQ